MTITVVGLGPGSPELITREVWKILESTEEVYLRTARHPTVAGLPFHLRLHSFDDLYENETDFEQIYRAMAEEIIRLGQRPQGVVYAVPGHPLVGETSVQHILEQAKAAGLPVRIAAGLSFLEPVLAALEIDAMDGLQLLDATDLASQNYPQLDPDQPALIAQLYSRALASDVKLTLMNAYPEDHPLRLVHNAGTAARQVEDLPLYELDHSPSIAHLTSLYVPPLPLPGSFENFQETIARLRAPGGCPWDREQTHQSLRSDLLEEAYEVLQALDDEDIDDLREELGDLLLHIVMQAEIAAESGEFSMSDVLAEIDAKIKRRHPHVFGEAQVATLQELWANWDAIKRAERDRKQSDTSVLAGVPAALPALAQADAYGHRARRAGFDWPDISGAIAKVYEEIEEVKKETGNPRRLQEEIGDLLFAVVDWARWLGADAETALREANQRFARRFRRVEAIAQVQGRTLKGMSLEELVALWKQAKAAEKAE